MSTVVSRRSSSPIRIGWSTGSNSTEMMRTFYNGYNFCLREERGLVFNPTLALYFFKRFQQQCNYPEEMLDSNLAMDRNRIEYVGRLPHGRELVENALEPATPIAVSRLENRFGVQMMLTPKDHGFPASLLSEIII